jgi:surface polysaccharide O-acyltransferase-like enzyme
MDIFCHTYAVAGFMIISGFFIVNSSSHLGKRIFSSFNTLFVWWLFAIFLAYCCFGYKLNGDNWYQYLEFSNSQNPVMQHWWFVVSYFFVVCLSSAINKLCKVLKWWYLLILIFMLWAINRYIGEEVNFMNFDIWKSIFFLSIMYMIGAFIRLHLLTNTNSPLKNRIFLCGSVLAISIVILFYCVFYKGSWSLGYNQSWSTWYNNNFISFYGESSSLSALAFCCGLFVIFYFIRPKSKILLFIFSWSGKISLGVYLLHKTVSIVLYQNIHMNYSVAFCMTVLILTILFSIIVSLLLQYVINKFSRTALVLTNKIQ